MNYLGNMSVHFLFVFVFQSSIFISIINRFTLIKIQTYTINSDCLKIHYFFNSAIFMVLYEYKVFFPESGRLQHKRVNELFTDLITLTLTHWLA